MTQSRWREPKERFLSELLWPADDERDRRYSQELIAEGHQRLVAPLYTVVFALIGVAALLAGEFNRRGPATRVLVAVHTGRGTCRERGGQYGECSEVARD